MEIWNKTKVLNEGKWPEYFIANILSIPEISISTKVKWRWNCSKHGVYEQLIGSHLIGKGCPKCARERARQSISISKRRSVNLS